MSIVTYIRTIMAARGIRSQRELALRMGISPQALAQKLDKGNFRLSDLKKIAEALDCTVSLEFLDKDTGESVL